MKMLLKIDVKGGGGDLKAEGRLKMHNLLNNFFAENVLFERHPQLNSGLECF